MKTMPLSLYYRTTPLPDMGFLRVFGGVPKASVSAGYFRWNSKKSSES